MGEPIMEPIKQSTPSDSELGDFSGLPGYYVNAVNIIVTNWDFRLLLGEVGPVSGGKVGIKPLASIVMSPEHTKALLQVLTKNVADYEKQHGEIAWKVPQLLDK